MSLAPFFHLPACLPAYLQFFFVKPPRSSIPPVPAALQVTVTSLRHELDSLIGEESAKRRQVQGLSQAAGERELRNDHCRQLISDGEAKMGALTNRIAGVEASLHSETFLGKRYDEITALCRANPTRDSQHMMKVR